jgi:hypothetical protein
MLVNRFEGSERIRARDPAKPALPGARRPTAGILRLQRAVGNRAIARLVAGEPRRVLARYDTGEHAQFGSDQVVFERGDVKITEAEMVTMGDLYERPEDMYQADIDELRRLVALVRRDKAAYLSGRVKEDGVSNAEWDKATPTGPHRKKSFMTLAEENTTHYAPRAAGSDGTDHKAEWERIHRQALDMAHAAKTPEEAQRALAFNAFAGHFLTDAFAAGHLPSKLDVTERAERNWNKQSTWGWIFTESIFTRMVAERVLADKNAGPKLRKYKLRIAAWGDMTEERLSELLWAFSQREPGLFFETFIKIVHDVLNRTGVEVDNARGDGPWVLPGDGRLASSPKTLEVANAAVAASVANLRIAYATKGPLDYPKLFANVWAYVPRPTKAAQAHIDDVLARNLDPVHRSETLDAFVEFLVGHIDAVIGGLHGQPHDRLITPDELDERNRKARAAADKWRRDAHIPIYRH